MASGVAALIPAAGVGSRLGSGPADEPKALRRVGERSLLEWSLAALLPLIDFVVAAVPAAYVDSTRAILGDAGRVTVVAGGASRQESVQLALAVVDPNTDFVLVHDAARPFVPAAVISGVIDALRAGASAVVPVLPVVDSLRQVGPTGVSAPVERATIRSVQTPQGFRRDVLARAHLEGADAQAGDDAILVERLGVPVTVVPGSELAFKITRPLDLLIAEAVLAAHQQRPPRRRSPS